MPLLRLCFITVNKIGPTDMARYKPMVMPVTNAFHILYNFTTAYLQL
jgi:hypothetical protein